jgi:hypothetical protein
VLISFQPSQHTCGLIKLFDAACDYILKGPYLLAQVFTCSSSKTAKGCTDHAAEREESV